MQKEIIILPGESINEGSANISYPYGQILNVKGFYEQDSHVMPSHLKKMEEDGRVWYEYVPESLDLTKKHPLIISWHGGGQSGWGQCFATSWYMVAEKYGLVVYYPTYGWGDSGKTDYAEFLLKRAREVGYIDETKIFNQGMSAGNMMTSVLSRTIPEKFAGGGMSAGPDNTMLFENPEADLSAFKPIPIYQSRGERDTLCPATVEGINRQLLNASDRDFWVKVNGCDMKPAVIKIDGRNDYLVYKGGVADVVFRDVKWRGHGQTIDDAEQMWRQYFSGLSRKADGTIVMEEPIDPVTTDHAVIFADGCSQMVVNSEFIETEAKPYEILQRMEISEAMIERNPDLKDPKNIPTYGPFLYVPVNDIAKAFGFETEYSFEGQRVYLKKEGLEIQLSDGNVASTVNGVIKNLERQVEFKEGILYAPLRSIAEFLGLWVIALNGVYYVTDHYGEMTNDMAAFLKGYMA